jgi:hypothetical protein
MSQRLAASFADASAISSATALTAALTDAPANAADPRVSGTEGPRALAEVTKAGDVDLRQAKYIRELERQLLTLDLKIENPAVPPSAELQSAL